MQIARLPAAAQARRMTDLSSWSFVGLVLMTFLLAGGVKGLVGLGLPTITVGLLSLVVVPAQAAAVMLVPSLVSNLWQAARGPAPWRTAWRLLPFLAALAMATVATGVVLPPVGSWSKAVLGVALIGYAAFALRGPVLRVPPDDESWVSLLAGWLAGALTALTGIAIMPTAPFLQGLDLDRDTLVQALGLTFTVSTLALGGVLWGRTLDGDTAVLSIVALGPTLAGMAIGRWLRGRLDPVRFRRLFLMFLLVLGGGLVVAA